MMKVMNRNNKKGFTLIELIVVISILAILSAILIPSIGNYINNAKMSVAKDNVRAVLSVCNIITTRSNIGEDIELNINSIYSESGIVVELGLVPVDNSIVVKIENNNIQNIWSMKGGQLASWSRENGWINDDEISIPEITATDNQYFIFNKDLQRITGYKIEGGINVIIPSEIDGKDVLSIGHAAFMDIDMDSVILPNTLTNIQVNAFHTNNLSSIIIPDSVTLINHNAFLNNNLTTVIIPENVKIIGDSAFSGNSLTSVTIYSRTTTFGTYAFAFQNNSQKLIIYGYSGSTAETYASQRGYVFIPI